VVLVEPRDVGDNAKVVGGERSVAELLKVGGPTNEHVVEPRGERDRDETSYGCGVDWLAVGALSWLLVPCEPMNAGGVAGVETDEASTDQVAVLSDVKARDEVVVADVTFWWQVPLFGNLTEIFFEVGDDVLETSDLGGVLGGAGLDREGETVDELLKLWGRDVGMSVEGGEH